MFRLAVRWARVLGMTWHTASSTMGSKLQSAAESLAQDGGSCARRLWTAVEHLVDWQYHILAETGHAHRGTARTAWGGQRTLERFRAAFWDPKKTLNLNIPPKYLIVAHVCGDPGALHGVALHVSYHISLGFSCIAVASRTPSRALSHVQRINCQGCCTSNGLSKGAALQGVWQLHCKCCAFSVQLPFETLGLRNLFP